MEAHRKAREIWKYNNAGVLGSSKKLNPVWKGICVVNKIMSAVLLELKSNKKVCVVYHDNLKKCENRDLPSCVERLRGHIKERQEGLSVDKNVGSGEGEGKLSSNAEEDCRIDPRR